MKLKLNKIQWRILVICGILSIIVGSAYLLVTYIPMYSKWLMLPIAGLLGIYFDDLMKFRTSSKFIDIDLKFERKEKSIKDNSYIDILKELNNIKNNVGKDDLVKKIEEIVQSNLHALKQEQVNKDTFSSYFKSTIRIIEDKSEKSDQKGSKLLDTGTLYIIFGLIFYLCTIIFWQFMFSHIESSGQITLGIFSCSLLFISIEFLGAWYLKQFKAFADDSAYQMKIKAIFDRYYLMYLLIEDGEYEKEDKKQLIPQLTYLLQKDIQWPDNPKSDSDNFMKEAATSMSEILKKAQEKVLTKD